MDKLIGNLAIDFAEKEFGTPTGMNHKVFDLAMNSFQAGFDAAMELNNSFQLWLIDARKGNPTDNPELFYYEKGYPYLKNYHWMFNYFLENIYQPSKP